MQISDLSLSILSTKMIELNQQRGLRQHNEVVDLEKCQMLSLGLLCLKARFNVSNEEADRWLENRERMELQLNTIRNL